MQVEIAVGAGEFDTLVTEVLVDVADVIAASARIETSVACSSSVAVRAGSDLCSTPGSNPSGSPARTSVSNKIRPARDHGWSRGEKPRQLGFPRHDRAEGPSGLACPMALLVFLARAARARLIATDFAIGAFDRIGFGLPRSLGRRGEP